MKSLSIKYCLFVSGYKTFQIYSIHLHGCSANFEIHVTEIARCFLRLLCKTQQKIKDFETLIISGYTIVKYIISAIRILKHSATCRSKVTLPLYSHPWGKRLQRSNCKWKGLRNACWFITAIADWIHWYICIWSSQSIYQNSAGWEINRHTLLT